MKLNDHDLVVLALAETGDWTAGYLLNGKTFNGVTQQQADRRLYEIFDSDVKDVPDQVRERKIGSDIFTIQTTLIGGERSYRAFKSGIAPTSDRMKIETRMQEQLKMYD